MVALASLASLLRALSVAGYARESLTISDILTNYILYESDSDSNGSFRKLCIAYERVEASIQPSHNSRNGTCKSFAEGTRIYDNHVAVNSFERWSVVERL